MSRNAMKNSRPALRLPDRLSEEEIRMAQYGYRISGKDHRAVRHIYGVFEGYARPGNPISAPMEVDLTGVDGVSGNKSSVSAELSYIELGKIEILTRFAIEPDCWTMLIERDGKTCILKAYPPYRRATRNGSPESDFENERKAYERLEANYPDQLSTDDVPRGVPHCYGWTEYRPWPVDFQLPTTDGLILPEPKSVWKGLLIEYIGDSEHLSYENVTEDLAEKALVVFDQMLRCGVNQNKPMLRNILVVQGSYIVFIDFRQALAFEEVGRGKNKEWETMLGLWSLLYRRMLPDKIVGFKGGWYWWSEPFDDHDEDGKLDSISSSDIVDLA